MECFAKRTLTESGPQPVVFVEQEHFDKHFVTSTSYILYVHQPKDGLIKYLSYLSHQFTNVPIPFFKNLSESLSMPEAFVVTIS